MDTGDGAGLGSSAATAAAEPPEPPDLHKNPILQQCVLHPKHAARGPAATAAAVAAVAGRNKRNTEDGCGGWLGFLRSALLLLSREDAAHARAWLL